MFFLDSLTSCVFARLHRPVGHSKTKNKQGQVRAENPRSTSLFAVLLLVELALLLRSGILILLALRDKVIHVALRLGELHLVHALAGVPMQEGLAPEHRREVLCYTLKHFLNRCTERN
ncbi:unnamed protein product [Prorocentrum cordatum]|uniref:Secreted protein n=1 Tax=Prorocentrum cordatum TaxID=2364126 RepID=A0ABN9VLC7_9DINO|nr:unnamed protein product [Polarella glacialis]